MGWVSERNGSLISCDAFLSLLLKLSQLSNLSACVSEDVWPLLCYFWLANFCICFHARVPAGEQSYTKGGQLPITPILLMSEKRVENGEGHWGTKTKMRVVIMVVQDGVIYQAMHRVLEVPNTSTGHSWRYPRWTKCGSRWPEARKSTLYLALPGASLATWVENETKGLHQIMKQRRNKNALGH